MDPQTTTVLLTGGFTIGGGLAVAIVSALLARSSERRKVKVEDSVLARDYGISRETVYQYLRHAKLA